MSEDMRMCTMTMEGELPCGCKFSHVVRSIGPIVPRFASFAGDVFKHWLEDRTPRHRCELVSEANPYGTAPRETTEK